MKRVLLYGMGKIFHDLFVSHQFGKEQLRLDGYRIVGATDQYANKYQEMIEDIPIIQHIDQRLFDVVIVTSNKYFNEIRNDLMKRGIDKSKIIPLKSLMNGWYSKIYGMDSLKNQTGIEIGGPTELFDVIYQTCKQCDNINFTVNTVWHNQQGDRYIYGGKILGNFLIADATDLSIIKDKSYDFVLSSNNLEHIANPIKALKEWVRILKEDGKLIVIVPNRATTFDHNRPYTSFEHLLEDFENKIEENDLSHLPEILKNHDYDMDCACGGKDAFLKRSYNNFDNRCLHHHVFNEHSLKEIGKYLGLHEECNMEIPFNYLTIWRK